MRYLTGILFAAYFLAGCNKKDGVTLVEGQVIVESTDQPLPFAEVQVWQAGGMSSGYSQVGTTYEADAQGRFSFRFPTGNSGGYILRAEKAPGYVTNWGYEVYLEEGRKNQQLRLRVQAPAWLRIQVQDTAPINEAGVHISSGGQLTFYARPALDTTVILPCQAGDVGIQFGISQARGEIFEYRQVQVAPLDTALVRFEY